MKVRVSKDSIDLEELKDCVSRRGYQLIAEKAAQDLERVRKDLETCDDMHQIRFLQGRAAALRTMLNYPAIIVDEIRDKQRKGIISE
jgi:hypothetical protein